MLQNGIFDKLLLGQKKTSILVEPNKQFYFRNLLNSQNSQFTTLLISSHYWNSSTRLCAITSLDEQFVLLEQMPN